jgi:hypothetical protein
VITGNSYFLPSNSNIALSAMLNFGFVLAKILHKH